MLMDVSIRKDAKSENEKFGARLFGSEPTPRLIANWMLAGLLHDVGYCADLCSHALEHIRFLRSPQLDTFRAEIERHLRLAEKKTLKEIGVLNVIPTNGKMEKRLDHGVVSALHMLYLKRGNGSSYDAQWARRISAALTATAKHSLGSATINPDKEEDRLAFLLLLCDHIQEWDRPRVESASFRRQVVSALAATETRGFESTTLLEFLRIPRLSVNGQNLQLTGADLTFELLFKDAGNGDFEPAMVWLNNTEDFQILEKGLSGVNISVKHIHPIAKKLAMVGNSFNEMDLLRDFANEKSKESYLTNWATSCLKTANWYAYSRGDNASCEFFTIKLSRLAKSKAENPILNIPDDLYGRFMQWKVDFLNSARMREMGHSIDRPRLR